MSSTPDASTSNSITYTRRQIFDFVRHVWAEGTNSQVAAVQSKLSEDVGSQFQITAANKKQLRLILSKLSTRWHKAQKKRDRFDVTNKNWLEGSFTFENGIAAEKQPKRRAEKKKAPEFASFDEVTDRQKRRRTQELRSSAGTSELVYAAHMSLRAHGAAAASTLLKAVTSNSPQRAAKYQKAYKDAQKPALTEISADVALNVIISGKMTKATYLMVRDVTNKNRSASVYPSYAKILAAKQRCYPQKSCIKITETVAEVQLQALLDHISARLIDVTKNSINAIGCEFLDKCTLICKWGCDGSSGQTYKQKFTDDNSSDADVFFTSVVPLELTAVSEKGDEVAFWRNLKPSSTRFCRPLRLQFLKESADNIRLEKQYVDDQIKSLVPFYAVVDARNIVIKYQLVFTMVDGKVKNAVTDTTSAQRCYICKATSKQFNSIDLLVPMEIDSANLTLGVSSLHAWIRFMEWFVHLAYKNSDDGTEKKWQSRSVEQKQRVANRKAQIQSEFKRSLGLLIDIPKQGSGTTNDGNTARRFFEDVSVTANILGIDEELMAQCKVVLQTMSSGCAINVDKFKMYCLNVARRYVELYAWYPMPTSVHVVLLHGYAIVEAAPLPIGRLSEDAQEARNKDIRRYREDFTRKYSREKTMHDVFHRLLASSDPLISSFQQMTIEEEKQLPPEVKDLLSEPPPVLQPDSDPYDSEIEVSDECDYEFY